jgi:hypothetical protein
MFSWKTKRLKQLPHSQIEVQILRFQIELGPQVPDRLFETHQGEADGLGLFRRHGACLHAAYRLAFHELPKELDQRQHQLHHRPLHVVRVRVPAWRACAPGKAIDLGAKVLHSSDVDRRSLAAP